MESVIFTRYPSSTNLPQNRGIYPVRRGLAEELGAHDRLGRGFSLDHRDIGILVDPFSPGPDHQREPLPKGHRFFSDCRRETSARMIQYVMNRKPVVDSLFSSLTLKSYLPERIAHRMLFNWLGSMRDGYRDVAGGPGLNWVVAQEWQKRQVIHFHLILSGVRLGDLSRKRWECRWQGIGGGYARTYDARIGAAPYLAKYCGKDQGADLMWGGTWRGITFPRSVGCCQA